MRPLASGRASEIFDLGDGRILRRGGNPQREARVMRHVAAHGYPVPGVLEVREDALVLERIARPTMLQELLRQPSLMRRHAALLAAPHRRLHEIDAGDGGCQLHMDLHPENVRRGHDMGDRRTSGGVLGRRFVRAFLPHFDLDEIRHALPAVGELRLADPNVTEDERIAVRRLIAPG
jgi:hypothetical protein